MIVVDTNVVVYLLMPGQYTAAARATFARDPAWAAPPLWRSELRNVLAPYLRQHQLTMDEAIALTETAESLFDRREYAVSSSAVLTLAAESGCSAYDCEFIATAQMLGVPLITSDRQLLRSFPAQAVDLREFAAGVG